eukprot:g1912.t1
MEVHVFLAAAKNARRTAKILRELPREDPPDDSPEFYDVQIPVEASNMGDAFTPKTPAELRRVDNQAKLTVVHMLTRENAMRLEAFFDHLHNSHELMLVSSSRDVTDYRRVNAKYSRKTDESILAKACRPSIIAKNPSYGVEHVRDTFRFKGVVYSFRDALAFVFAMDKSEDLCPNGLCKDNVAKLDIVKLHSPKEWGWRFLAFDFVMPNRQIVEVRGLQHLSMKRTHSVLCQCYIVFEEMEAAKKSMDGNATVCSELSNHEIFEKWRIRDVAKLTAEERTEYEADIEESNRRYDRAFGCVLAHTSEEEQAAFWKPFAESDDELRRWSRARSATLQVPMDAGLGAARDDTGRSSARWALSACAEGAKDAWRRFKHRYQSSRKPEITGWKSANLNANDTGAGLAAGAGVGVDSKEQTVMHVNPMQGAEGSEHTL